MLGSYYLGQSPHCGLLGFILSLWSHYRFKLTHLGILNHVNRLLSKSFIVWSKTPPSSHPLQQSIQLIFFSKSLQLGLFIKTTSRLSSMYSCRPKNKDTPLHNYMLAYLLWESTINTSVDFALMKVKQSDHL